MNLEGTPSRFREVDPSALGGNNDEVPAGATGRQAGGLPKTSIRPKLHLLLLVLRASI